MKLVLDASVILKLVLVQDESHSEGALEIVKNFQNDLVEIILPSFWRYEIGNILIFREEENYEDFYSFLLDIGFPTHDFSNDELIKVGKFAKANEVSFYGAAYHFLAKLTSSVFVTADEKYIKKAEKAGDVVLLKKLTLPP